MGISRVCVVIVALAAIGVCRSAFRSSFIDVVCVAANRGIALQTLTITKLAIEMNFQIKQESLWKLGFLPTNQLITIRCVLKHFNSLFTIQERIIEWVVCCRSCIPASGYFPALRSSDLPAPMRVVRFTPIRTNLLYNRSSDRPFSDSFFSYFFLFQLRFELIKICGVVNVQKLVLNSNSERFMEQSANRQIGGTRPRISSKSVPSCQRMSGNWSASKHLGTIIFESLILRV